MIGNGWAASGMLRVLGTIQNSQYAESMKNEQNDLTNWVKEIHTGMYDVLVSSHHYRIMVNMVVTHCRVPGFQLPIQKLPR